LRRAALCTPIQELINGGRVDQVLLADRADTALLVVRQAAVLQFPPAGGTGIRAGRVVVVADRAPVAGMVPTGVTSRRSVRRRLAGCSTPNRCGARRTQGVRASLRTVEPGLAMTDADLPTVVDGSGWVAERAAAADAPIVGTDLCDAAAWPADATTRSAYIAGLPAPMSGSGCRTVRNGRWSCRRSGWRTLRPTSEPRPFLHQLDFYLHFPHPRAAEVFSRPVLEAAALGCVVMLPERFAALYGDAAVYAEPG
jgi:hypothetical protein